MARVTYSAFITEINGSAGGTTFQRNRYGHTVKNKPTTSRPNNIKQQTAKYLISYAQAQWRQLSTEDRDTWNTFASLFPQPTRLNANSYLNGQSLFIRRRLAEMPPISSIDSTVLTPASADTSPGVSTDGTDLYLAANADNIVGEVRLVAFGAPRNSQAQNNPRGKMRKLIAFNPATTDPNMATAWLNTFGVLPSVGDSVFIQFILIQNDGATVTRYPFWTVTVSPI